MLAASALFPMPILFEEVLLVNILKPIPMLNPPDTLAVKILYPIPILFVETVSAFKILLPTAIF